MVFQAVRGQDSPCAVFDEQFFLKDIQQLGMAGMSLSVLQAGMQSHSSQPYSHTLTGGAGHQSDQRPRLYTERSHNSSLLRFVGVSVHTTAYTTDYQFFKEEKHNFSHRLHVFG